MGKLAGKLREGILWGKPHRCHLPSRSGVLHVHYLRLDSYIVFMKIGVITPQIIHFNGVFHEINHPFWDTPIFGNTHIHIYIIYIYIKGGGVSENMFLAYLFAVKFLCCRYLREELETYADGIIQYLNAMIEFCNMFYLAGFEHLILNYKQLSLEYVKVISYFIRMFCSDVTLYIYILHIYFALVV